MKNEKGITIIGLVVTIIIILIIAGISIGLTQGRKDVIVEAKSDVLLTNLKQVQQAVLETYIKYKQTENDNVLIGEKVTWADANQKLGEIATESSSTLSLKQSNYDFPGIEFEKDLFYYKITPENLAQFGIKDAEDTYIVNYKTGEVFDITEQTTGNDESLYIVAKETEPEYIQDGLLLHYDGINNTGNGHSNTTTTWKDLSGNGNDGTLKGGTTWNNDYLNFNGTYAWVSIGVHNPENVTLEIVSLNNALYDEEREYICNFEGGGMGINYETSNNEKYNRFEIYIENSGYAFATSSNVLINNKKYYLSGSYDGTQMKFFENKTKITNEIIGTIRKPGNNSILMLGENPNGNEPGGRYWLDGNVYSVRIYNRALTDDEVAYNYAIDKARFNIEE